MRRLGRAIALATGLLVGVAGASAQDYGDSGAQYDLGLGIGALAKPKYPGADDYIVVPYPIFAVGRLWVPFIGQTERRQSSGFYFYPSFGVNGERKPSDDPSLRGTKKVPWALDLGLGAGFRHGIFQGYASVRQGLTGHEGQVGDFGLNLVVPVTPRINVAFGPKGTWGSNDYMDTYFGVTKSEAAAGPLKQYNPSGGLVSAGLNLRTTYRVSERTSLHVRANWDRLVGDAEKSPIVKAGSKDQWSFGVGISRRFDFNLFR